MAYIAIEYNKLAHIMLINRVKTFGFVTSKKDGTALHQPSAG
jgi:hypothetical protein